jgi:hypothetical protein
MHPDTAARAYYSYPNYRVSTFYGFFLDLQHFLN